MKPLVSILIPCYNAAPWIAQTLQSALNQTWSNLEIIMVDDGSTDDSFAIAKSFESSQVKVIQQSNQGASVARNQALSLAQGDYIQYLDADDLLAPDKIRQQVEQLSLNQNAGQIAAGEWARFYHDPETAIFSSEPVWEDFAPVDWLICSWNGGGMMHPAAWLIPRNIAGTWDESLSLHDDGEYFCRVVLASRGVKFCWGARSYYRSGLLNSLSRANSQSAIESGFQAIELEIDHLLAAENSDRTRRACATALQRFIYSVYPDAPDLIAKAEKRVESLGGTNLPPSGGSRFLMLSKVVGWKTAKRLQNLILTANVRSHNHD